MSHARIITAFSILGALAGCGGGTTNNTDTGPVGGSDMGPAMVDAFVAPDMGPGDVDAFVDVDAFTDVDAGPSDVDAFMAGACTNSADETVIAMNMVPDQLQTCTNMHTFDANARRSCIETTTGLTMACADCYADEVTCGINMCAGQCAANPNGTMCRNCVSTHCDPPFNACAGTLP